jgi:hypothetical protein
VRALATHGRHLLRDAVRNLAHRRRGRRFLVVRDTRHQASFNDDFLDYLARRYPEARSLFELRRVTCRVRDWGRYALFLPWLQDPLRERFPTVYSRAAALESACRGHGVPVVHPVDAGSRAIKSVALPLLRAAGIRTARVVAIGDREAFRRDLGGLDFPLLVREDRIHSDELWLARDAAELQHVPIERLAHPIALEFIDGRGSDGLYRKYRYVLMGEVGLPRHLVVSRSWLVRARERVRTPAALEEEIAYLRSADPHHHILRRAQEALGLDVVAFDYGYDRDGTLVVWEPNPFANLWQGFNRERYYDYQRPFLERIYDALLRYYLERSSLAADERALLMPAGA